MELYKDIKIFNKETYDILFLFIVRMYSLTGQVRKTFMIGKQVMCLMNLIHSTSS